MFHPREGTGVALLADHTTSYAHGAEQPLGLTLQYSGIGLWGRNYSVQGPTEVKLRLCSPTAGTGKPPVYGPPGPPGTNRSSPALAARARTPGPAKAPC